MTNLLKVRPKHRGMIRTCIEYLNKIHPKSKYVYLGRGKEFSSPFNFDAYTIFEQQLTKKNHISFLLPLRELSGAEPSLLYFVEENSKIAHINRAAWCTPDSTLQHIQITI